MDKEKQQIPVPKAADLPVPPAEQKTAPPVVADQVPVKKGVLARLRPRLKTKKKEDTLTKELRGIYTDEAGELPDFGTLERARSARVRNILIVLVAFFGLLAAAAWAGFFFFQPGAFHGDGVRVTVASAEPLVAGKEGRITVRYTNGERVALGSFEVRVTVPDGFAITSTSPQPTEGTRFVLGTIGSGQSGEITLTGDVTAALGTMLPFSAYATYIPANFNSEFQAVGALQANVTDAVIHLTVSGPEQIPAGEPVAYVVRYENVGERPLTGLRMELFPPQDFLLETVSPAADEKDKRIALAEVPPGQSGEVTVSGSYSSEASGGREMRAVVGYVRAEPTLLPFAHASSTTDVLGSDLVLTTITNGMSAGGRVNFGDTLRTTVSYENRGTVDLTGVEVSLVYVLTPDTVPFARLDALADDLGGTRQGTRVTWTKKHIAGLAKLAPGDAGTIDVALPVVAEPPAGDHTAFTIEVFAQATVAKVGTLTVGRTVNSSHQTLALNSNLACSMSVRYFTDEDLAVGTGPVPPRVGQATSYRVLWRITNTLHELSNLRLTVPLAPAVRFSERRETTAGAYTHNAASSTMAWELNRLPVGVGEVAGSFDVVLEPRPGDAGKVMPLTGPVSCEALDTTAGGVIVRPLDPVDTNLLGDPQVEGRGTVQPAE